MNTFQFVLFVFGIFASVYAYPSGYDSSLGYTAMNSYGKGGYGGYGGSKIVASLPDASAASAAAITDLAGAKAGATKFDVQNWADIDEYGRDIGNPLMVKPYGSLTDLYASSLPSRSFVGRIDPGWF